MKLRKIIDVIEKESGEKINVPNRKRHIVSLRFIYFKLAKELTKLSLEKIAIPVKKDHATVIHGLKMFEIIYKEKEYRQLYDKCKRELIGSPAVSEFGIDDVVSFYETLLSEMQLKYEIAIKEQRLDVYDKLLSMDKPTFERFINTRLNPFLQMNKAS